MKTALFICVLASTLSTSAFAITKSGPACLEALTNSCSSVTNSAVSSALNCKNEHSVVAMQALASSFCAGGITNSAVKSAAKVNTEEEAACIKALSRLSSVTNSALKSCVSWF